SSGNDFALFAQMKDGPGETLRSRECDQVDQPIRVGSEVSQDNSQRVLRQLWILLGKFSNSSPFPHEKFGIACGFHGADVVERAREEASQSEDVSVYQSAQQDLVSLAAEPVKHCVSGQQKKQVSGRFPGSENDSMCADFTNLGGVENFPDFFRVQA